MIPVMRPWMGVEEQEAATEAVRSGWVAQGPRVAAFEEAFAAAVGSQHAVAVSSCTAGLHLSLVVAEIGPGDEVIIPSLSFIATANVVRYVGATPVFADVEAATGNLSVETIERVWSPRTRAVILVHQGGMPADLNQVTGLCNERGIALIEDAACAAGSTYQGQPIGSGSLLAAFSFHPRKLITTGEGGMVVTADSGLAGRMRRLREHGMSVSAVDRHSSARTVLEEYLETGFNYRMTDIQAAVGLVQLGRLKPMIERRRELASRYQVALSDIPGLEVVRDPSYGTSNYQSFWVVLPDDAPVDRNDLLDVMLEEGISARRGIMASHLEPAFQGHPTVQLPVTERLTARSVILPLFHELTEHEQDHVIRVFRRESGA